MNESIKTTIESINGTGLAQEFVDIILSFSPFLMPTVGAIALLFFAIKTFRRTTDV
jgi:hypothetical protein